MKRSLAADIAGLAIGAVLVAAFFVPLFLMGSTNAWRFIVDIIHDPEVPGGLCGHCVLLAILLFTPLAGVLFTVRSFAGVRDAVRDWRAER